MNILSFEEFKKIDIRIGKIIGAERIEGSEKLLKLEVDFGISQLEELARGKNADSPTQIFPENLGGQAQNNAEKHEVRQVVAGIGRFYSPENLIGKECPFVFNLETRIIKGLESQGMILAADDKGPALLHPDKQVSPGSIVK